MKFWQCRIQCQNFISALLRIVSRKMKDAIIPIPFIIPEVSVLYKYSC
ncbi:MAG: hypothetical protein GY795_44250 [Desulfobacterales bacterium]|nr:hypothetical protein [Desulfobacterales bacterium]